MDRWSRGVARIAQASARPRRLGPVLAAFAVLVAASVHARLAGRLDPPWLLLFFAVGAAALAADAYRRSRRAEIALRAAHELQARHVEGSPLAVVEWDAGFRVSSVSPRAEALFGWSAAELVGKRADEIPWVPPEAWPAVRRVMEDMISGARPSNVNANRNLRKDGSAIECEWYNSALHDGNGRLVSVLSLVLDVTARERALAELEESRARLELFVRHAPAAIAMFDREMRYLAASERYLADYHLDVRPVVGRSHYDLFPEMPERWKEIHRRCLAGAVARSDADPFPRADGRTDWVRWEIRPWHDGAGRVGGLLLFSEVITALREMERQAARGERLEAIATLVRGMSHEVNSPLASVITNVEFARGGLRGAPAPLREAWDRQAGLPVGDLEEALADAAGAAARVKAIMRDLSAFLPHPGDGSQRGTLESALRKALRLAHHELVPCAAVRTDLAAVRDVAMAEDDLVQLLAGLLVNAGLATGPAPNVVTVTARPAGAEAVEVEVGDTGVGMDAATLARLFEPFFTTRPPGRGKGLGVARCRVIAESAGGELSYRSRPGQGTTARLLLPLVPAAASGPDPAAARR